jgi:hypothetical protein
MQLKVNSVRRLIYSFQKIGQRLEIVLIYAQMVENSENLNQAERRIVVELSRFWVLIDEFSDRFESFD